MSYIENPKTKGSGIICAIPQTGTCPNDCEDCFFQSGRSYLEPLDENLPNLPTLEMAQNHVVRVNDGNDSNVDKKTVLELTKDYPFRFYNTAIPHNFETFDAPVVLTLNPGNMTDREIYYVHPIPKNLMFVRFRTNMWNVESGLIDKAHEYYAKKKVPLVLTFMAYYKLTIPEEYRKYYVERKRTLNSYWAITTEGWERVMSLYKYDHYVYSCGKIEGEKGITGCARCGNCLREFFATKERMENK